MIAGTFHEVRQVRLIPFVCGAGAKLAGSERGPVEIKKHGLQAELSSAWRQVAWQEDPEILYLRERDMMAALPPLGSPERRIVVLDHCRDIADRVEAVVRSGAMPVTLGGDHSMAAGTIAGFARAKNAHGRIGVIWIDAHGDIHTPETSPSKAIHGMPVASLLGIGDKDFSMIGGAVPVLRPEHIAYLGLRSTEPEEDERIRAMGIRAYAMKDISPACTEEVFNQAWEVVTQGTDYFVLSIDLDAFDPEEASSVGSPEPGGFKKAETLAALGKLAAKRMPDMIEIVEFNPAMGDADKTYALLRDILKALLGERILYG
ncbi:MAG: arginase [Alphaproteobacteria bacterium]